MRNRNKEFITKNLETVKGWCQRISLDEEETNLFLLLLTQEEFEDNQLNKELDDLSFEVLLAIHQKMELERKIRNYANIAIASGVPCALFLISEQEYPLDEVFSMLLLVSTLVSTGLLGIALWKDRTTSKKRAHEIRQLIHD